MVDIKDQKKSDETSGEEKDRGASMVEYALLLVLIAIVAILAITLVGQDVSATFSEIASAL